MEIKNLRKAAERIKKAVKDKEKIILYGDADLDGVVSVIVLRETIKNLGGNVTAVYFPDRETEGYGLSDTGLSYLKQFSPGLLVTLDFGIGNFQQVKDAKKMGFNVIIIDHHEILDGVPKADIVVDPKQKGDRYPFKGFANAGITFKLAEIMFGDKMTESVRKNFLELVALATVADMMPREADNEIIITEGLRFLEESWRPGVKVFFEPEFFSDYELKQKISKIISVLNVRDVKNQMPASFRLLSVSSVEEAKEIIKGLLEKNEQRREKIKEISSELEKRISGKEEPIIFEGDSNWDISLISIIASIAVQNFGKPAFIYKIMNGESQGTVRAPEGIDSVALMKKCKKLLITFGGHPAASGFRIKSENLGKFKSCLIKNLKKNKK
ncbi:MAG: DHH family phosphoesterase [Patescibacteria group bacterium]